MGDEPQGKFVGVVDEYGSVWSGKPGESELIGDLVIQADGETSALYLGTLGRSPESNEPPAASQSDTEGNPNPEAITSRMCPFCGRAVGTTIHPDLGFVLLITSRMCPFCGRVGHV